MTVTTTHSKNIQNNTSNAKVIWPAHDDISAKYRPIRTTFCTFQCTCKIGQQNKEVHLVYKTDKRFLKVPFPFLRFWLAVAVHDLAQKSIRCLIGNNFLNIHPIFIILSPCCSASKDEQICTIQPIKISVEIYIVAFNVSDQWSPPMWMETTLLSNNPSNYKFWINSRHFRKLKHYICWKITKMKYIIWNILLTKSN